MADKAAVVMAEAEKGFAQYRQQNNPSAQEQSTFVAGFMAGYLAGFSEGLEDNLFGRVVARMISNRVDAIAVPYNAKTYTLSLR